MSSTKHRFIKFWSEIFDLIAFLILVFWIVLFIRLFIATPYTVIGSSMHPNFEEKDWIIVEKMTQNFWTFDRWDVIVFVAKWKESPYIKRIIWLPWETILIEDNKVFVCSKNNPTNSIVKDSEWYWCEILPEDYLAKWAITEASCGKNEFKISDSGYFVMWDNRWRTTDSLCCFGIQCTETTNYLVYPEDLIWKVRVRLYPKFTKF